MNPSAILGLSRFGGKLLPVQVLGLLATCVGLWIGLGSLGQPPFTTIWLRTAVVGAVVAIAALVAAIQWTRRRRAAAALERDVVAPRAPGDAAILSERMGAALDTLRKAGGKTYLYDLPWYIIIGPPGAGKTTALRNSGIEFPGSRLDAVEGLSGTRNCDWWFAEDAVLIDTAGRYTSQDSDVASDAASWTAFLQLLKRHRPRQPISGVILTFSCEELIGARTEDLAKHAATVRQRLSEIHEHLKIDFPVYLVFSKADLIAGFRETFATLTPQRRKAVWGVTFQTRDRQEATWQGATKEFEALLARLSDGVSDRLAEEIDGPARLAILGFPGQMALLKGNLVEFLRQVFAPTRFGTAAILRGFYFASGTQEGTPIDQVLGAMSRDVADGEGVRSVQLSGRGKAFFLEDLLSRVIFAERDWVGFDAAAARRGAALRTAAIAAIALLTIGAAGVLGATYRSNDQFLRGASSLAQDYAASAKTELDRERIDDPDPRPVLPHLATLRRIAASCERWSAGPANGDRDDAAGSSPADGFADRFRVDLPLLNQREAVRDATCTAYRDGLERMLRPRLILRAENHLEQLIHDDQVADLYQALKVYLLLGRVQDGGGDDEALRAYFRRAWEQDFPGVASADARAALEAHLDAMLALDNELGVDPTLEKDLIERARGKIVELPVADQAYAVILDRAFSREVTELSLVDLAGEEAAEVFELADGAPAEEIGVPAIYSFDGYWGQFIPEVEAIAERLAADGWVLGDAASAAVAYDQQLAELEGELQQIYRRRFAEAWAGLLSRISVRPVNAEGGLDVLQVASSEASPIFQLARSIHTHTHINRLFDDALAAEAAEPGVIAGDELPETVTSQDLRRLYNGSATVRGILQGFVADMAKDTGRVGGGGAGGPQEAAERLTETMENWHVLFRGEPGAQPVDRLRGFLRAVYDVRYRSEVDAASLDRQLLQPALAELTANNSSLPEPLAGWLNEVASDLRAQSMDSTMEELNRALNDTITVYCQQRIEGKFPFGDGPEVPLDDFYEFFGPNGLMHRFHTERLASLVTQTAGGLRPVEGDRLAERLSPVALDAFRRAQDIRAEFFSAGGDTPQVSLDVSRTASSAGVETVVLLMGEESLVTTQSGDADSLSVVWPEVGSGVSMEVYPQAGRDSLLPFGRGRWALAEFLRGQSRVEGNQAEVTHVVGGRSVTFRVVFPDSQTVPFLMDELSEFSCPTSLE